MKHGITLTQVYDAMRAGGPLPVTREGMQDALRATGLWDDRNGRARVEIALSAYGLLGPAGSAESNMQRSLEAVAQLQFIAPKPRRAEVKQGEVTEAIRAYVAGPDPLGVFEPEHQLISRLRERLGVDYALAGHDWEQRAAEGKFARQVKTGLDKLAADGTLRKVGAGDRGPDGYSNYRNQVRYFTPQAWEVAERETAQAKTKAQDLDAAWQALRERLSALGIDAARNRAHGLSVDLDGWQALLELAESAVVRP